MDNEHLHAPSLRKLVISKFLKVQSCKGQDTSSAPLKAVLHLSKKVGMVKGGMPGRNKAGREMLSIWKPPPPQFPRGEMGGECC